MDRFQIMNASFGRSLNTTWFTGHEVYQYQNQPNKNDRLQKKLWSNNFLKTNSLQDKILVSPYNILLKFAIIVFGWGWNCTFTFRFCSATESYKLRTFILFSVMLLVNFQLWFWNKELKAKWQENGSHSNYERQFRQKL